MASMNPNIAKLNLFTDDVCTLKKPIAEVFHLKGKVGELISKIGNQNKIFLEKPKVIAGTVHCSPGDEPILTTKHGYVSIENLDENHDKIISYDSTCNNILGGFNTGYRFKKSIRPYEGTIISIITSNGKTRITPNHMLRVRLAKDAANCYIVYLMKRKNWWRIGMTKTFSIPYISGGVRGRIAGEKADGAWILGFYKTLSEAKIAELKLSGKYGIPTATFQINSKHRTMSNSILNATHDEISEYVIPRAMKLLNDFDFIENIPLFENRENQGPKRLVQSRFAFDTCAANLVPELMEVRIFTNKEIKQRSKPVKMHILRILLEDGASAKTLMKHFNLRTPLSLKKLVNKLSAFDQKEYVIKDLDETIEPNEENLWSKFSIKKEHFSGNVYGLDVEKYHYYVSGGIVVHNSVKGGEADSVWIDTRTSPKGYRMWQLSQEARNDEARVAYVAVTRARERVGLIDGWKKGDGYPNQAFKVLMEKGNR